MTIHDPLESSAEGFGIFIKMNDDCDLIHNETKLDSKELSKEYKKTVFSKADNNGIYKVLVSNLVYDQAIDRYHFECTHKLLQELDSDDCWDRWQSKREYKNG